MHFSGSHGFVLSALSRRGVAYVRFTEIVPFAGIHVLLIVD